MIKTAFDLLNLSQKARDGLNESASKKGYPPVFIGYNLNTEYRFVVSNDNVGTVLRWFPPGIYVDKVMFYYLPKGEDHKVWLFTDGRVS